jgi:nitrate/nitrite transporter NarK
MQAKAVASVAGQDSALWMSTIAFTVCFAVWTIFAIIGIQIKQKLGLNEPKGVSMSLRAGPYKSGLRRPSHGFK